VIQKWYSLTLEKLPIVQLLKNFPAFYGTRIITAFTRALHWPLSYQDYQVPVHSPKKLLSQRTVQKSLEARSEVLWWSNKGWYRGGKGQFFGNFVKEIS
jgi:hypothetical protein